jgi:hypothetical protein
MKKVFILLLICCITTGFVMADNFRLSTGLGFGVDNVSASDDAESNTYIQYILTANTSAIGEGIRLFSRLTYDMNFNKSDGLYLNFELSYNLGGELGMDDDSGNGLNFILRNDNYFLFDSTMDNNIAGIIRPGIMYHHSFDNVWFSLQASLPIAYSFFGMDTFTGLNISAYFSSIRTTIQAVGHILFDGDNTGFTGISLFLRRWGYPVSFEVQASIPFNTELPCNYFDLENNYYGISITPILSFSMIRNFRFQISCTFDRIGIEDMDIGINPLLRLMYNFRF